MVKQVLLIGGEGFIGNRFIEQTYNDDAYHCNTWDIKSKNNINISVPKDTVYDTVIFLAARSNLKNLLQNTKDGFKTATIGLQNAIKHYSDCHFIYISSSMVYGNWTSNTMSETDLCSPNNMYGTLKLLSEQIVKQFHNNYTIVRPSAVYGFGDNSKRITQLFINKIKNNKSIVLQGADNLFDFTHVDDVVQGLKLICQKGAENQTYNITKGEAHTLQDFTDMLYKKLEKTPNYTVQPVPENYPKRGALDISKAQTNLQYNPKFSLSDGLDDTINKYR